MGHDSSTEQLDALPDKLLLIKSPVVTAGEHGGSDNSSVQQEDVLEGMGYRDGPGGSQPSFHKHEDATNSEVFLDLFFAANLAVFGESQAVTKADKFSSYVGFFCLLWFTWLVVGLFDVRFVTDSIFERAAKGVHLGIMVGFAVVAQNFNPSQQNVQTMRTMSLILMVSRLTLAVEYLSVTWHVRKFQKARLPMALMVALNLAAAIIYLGITFRFRADKESHVIYAWYITSVGETLISIAMSWRWTVLSFTGTHLIRRMALLTLIVVGEGIVVIGGNVTTIVKNPESWTPSTIGVVTAAVALIYFVFMIYFDNMRHQYLPPFRQQLWAFMHFPFHLALVLFMEGATQFVIWWKVLEIETGLSDTLADAFDQVGSTINRTSDFVDLLTNRINAFLTLYPPTYTDTVTVLNEVMGNISAIPDSFWQINFTDVQDPRLAGLEQNITVLWDTLDNILLTKFKIDLTEDVDNDAKNTTIEAMQDQISAESWQRFNLVFIYSFATAGVVLILLNVLYAISRTEKWRPWNIVRIIFTTALGIGLCLTSLVSTNIDAANAYEISPWLLPTLCLTYFTVLVLNHLPHPPPLFFRKRARPRSGVTGFESGPEITVYPGT